jgi:hypothetical protein
METVRLWLRVWRLVQQFPDTDYGFLVGLIQWFEEKGFSPRSMADTLQEYRKLTRWMVKRGIISLGEVDNLKLQRYLLGWACGQSNASKQKILGNLRAAFHYYQESVDGGYRIPDYVVKAPRPLGINVSAKSEEIDALWEALQAGHCSPMTGLILVLIIGYGLPVRSLPLLRLTGKPGGLVYTERRPSRLGVMERWIQLDLQTPWLTRLWEAYLNQRKASPDYPYLFVSRHSQRRKKPVSVDFCQTQVQAEVEKILGYPIPANYLERGALKRLAQRTPLTDFMGKTEHIPLCRRSRLMYWLINSRLHT